MTPQQAFRAEYGDGKNFMTPNFLAFGTIRPEQDGFGVFYELSSGRGFAHEKIWGLTVVRTYPWGTRRLYRLSTCYHSRSRVHRTIAELKEKLGR